MYFCEIAWLNQDYSIYVGKNQEDECDTLRTDLNGSRQAITYNQGIYGQDPMGLVWGFQDFSGGPCPAKECGDSADAMLRNGSAVIAGQPNPYLEQIIYLSCRPEGYEQFFSGTGVVTGFGYTQAEALADARAKLSP